MRIPRSLFVSGCVILCQAVSVYANTPASLVGLQLDYQSGYGVTTSVPSQELYGSDGYLQLGFSGSSVSERIAYSYAEGVITYSDWGEELRLVFIDDTSGSFELYETDYPNPDGEAYLSGTFTVVTPTLVEKTSDWQHSAIFAVARSLDDWNVWRRSVDSVAYNDQATGQTKGLRSYETSWAEDLAGYSQLGTNPNDANLTSYQVTGTLPDNTPKGLTRVKRGLFQTA